MGTYLNYCYSLQFEDQPNYDYLRGLFKDVLNGADGEHDGFLEWSPWGEREGHALPGEIRERDDAGPCASHGSTTEPEHRTIGTDTEASFNVKQTKCFQYNNCGRTSRNPLYMAGISHAWLDPGIGQDAPGTSMGQPQQNRFWKLGSFFASIIRCGTKTMRRN